ncbi:MAG: transcription antitermination protein NusB [Bacteroidia bacterium]|nr:transcription antitermination protein NusB [Bacteroidia bacterium]
MISRRLVRIKTLQGLYSWQQSGIETVSKGQSVLAETLLVPFEVYLFLLEFPMQFRQFLESALEAEKSKYYPDKNLIHDCGLLQNSNLVDTLYNAALNHKRQFFKNDWNTSAEQFEQLFQELRELDFVRDYLVFDQPSLEQDKLFLEQFYEYLVNGSELFYGLMEEHYSCWDEDEPLLLKEVKRTLNTAAKDGSIKLSPRPSRTDEDIEFGIKLFGYVGENSLEYENMIADVTENWDPGRIAILDLFAIKLAIAEYLNFPEIPVKVTINEYLDIVKDYSTPGSSRFLNGVLDKLRKKLEEDGTIQKKGRGLRDR